MPNAPSTNLFTRFVLENPWPLGIVLLAIAVFIAWRGLREGMRNRVRIAVVLATLGGVVITAGSLVTTSGEHGKQVTRALVEAVVSEDLVGGLALFSDDAEMRAGSPQNPGVGIDVIQRQFSLLADRYTIESNSITRLRGYSISADEAEVRLACLTYVSAIPNTSQWILRVRRMPEGQWRITRLTCVAINDQTPDVTGLWP